MVTHSSRHLVHVQVSNAHGWHGARNMARANEQRKQKQQKKRQQLNQQQMQKQQQKQKLEQKQAKQQQQQNGGEEARVSSLSPDPAGTLSVDGVEACIPPFAHTASSDITVCWLSLLLTRRSFVRRTHRWPSRRRARPL